MNYSTKTRKRQRLKKNWSGRNWIGHSKLHCDKYPKELGLKAERMPCHALRHGTPDAIARMQSQASGSTTGLYTRIADKIAENPARYLEELMGLS